MNAAAAGDPPAVRPMAMSTAGRAGAGHAGARDLVAIADGLNAYPSSSLGWSLRSAQPSGCSSYSPRSSPGGAGPTIATSWWRPHRLLSEGNLIHDGVDPLLDGLRNQLDDQDAWLSHQEKERQRSGISTLKLQHHRTFGYFLAVSSQGHRRAGPLDPAPDPGQRGTLHHPGSQGAGGPHLQLRARACQREYELFRQLREQVGPWPPHPRRPAPLLPSMPSPAWPMWPPAVAIAPPPSPTVGAGGQPPSGGGATAGGNRLHPE